MTDELWRHALKTLEHYPKQECEIQELYNHEDQTGILEKHKKVLQLDNGRKPDPKTMYHELIRMLVDHERSHCDQTAYKEVKDVSKIQGYQDLTNKLLRNINEKLAEELSIVTDKLDRLEKVMGISDEEEGEEEEVFEEEIEPGSVSTAETAVIQSGPEEHALQGGADSSSSSSSSDGSVDIRTKKKIRRRKKKPVTLAEKLTLLEATVDDHGKRIGEVKGESNRMTEDIADLYSKLKVKDEVDSDIKSRQDELIETQKSLFETFEKRLDTNEEHIALLQSNDSEQDAKIVALENADTFLQGIHKEAAIKTDAIEESTTTQKHDIEKLKATFDDFVEGKGVTDEGVAKSVVELAAKQAHLIDSVDELNEKLTNSTKDVEEKAEKLIKETRQELETEHGEGIKDTKHKIEEIEGLIRKMEDEVQNLAGSTNNAANDIKVLTENDTKLDERLDKMEADANNLAGEFSEKIANNKEDSTKMSEKIAELKAETVKADEKLKELDQKTNGNLLVEITNIQKQLELNQTQINQFTTNNDGKLNELEKFVKDNADKIEEGNLVIKRNTEQIIPLIPLVDEVHEVSGKVNTITSELQAVDARQQEAIDALQRDVGGCKTGLEDVNDRWKIIEEKVFGLEEQHIQQQEKVMYVDRLRADLHAMDEQKQQSDALLKQDLDIKEAERMQTMADLRDLLDTKIEVLEDRTSGHDRQLNEVRDKHNAFEFSIGNLTGTTDDHDSKLKELESLVKSSEAAVQKLVVETVPAEVERNVKASVNDHINGMRGLVDEKLEQVDALTKDNEKHVENLRELNEHLLDKMKKQLQEDINEQKKHLEEIKFSNTSDISGINDKIADIMEQMGKLNKDAEIQDLLEARNHLEVKIKELEVELKEASRGIEVKLDEKLAQTEGDITNINQLILQVQEEVGGVNGGFAKTRDSIKSLRTDLDTNQQDTWKLFNQVYSTLRGYTVVLKSEGGASQHQPSCLGVYRLTDTLNERPVYKQEGGENYLYYNDDKASWMVGTNIGDPYAWIKNDQSNTAGSSDSSASSSGSDGEGSDGSLGSEGLFGGRKKLRTKRSKASLVKGGHPELLESGWKYKPNGFELATFSDDDNLWMEDDLTLKVEALKDVTLIGDIIKEIKISKEVD